MNSNGKLCDFKKYQFNDLKSIIFAIQFLIALILMQ